MIRRRPAIAGAILAWFLVSEVATEAWYRWKESQVPVTEPWPIDWPTEENAAKRGFRNFKPREMTAREKELLAYQKGVAASWRDNQENQWSAFYLTWNEDFRLNQMDLTHNPTLCLGATGWKLEKTFEPFSISLPGYEGKVLGWVFSSGKQEVYVYILSRRKFALVDPKLVQGYFAIRGQSIIKAVNGNRGNPLETLEIMVVGPKTAEEAKAEFEKQLQLLFRGS